MPGGGCALPGLPVRVLLPVGPRKRSAAGQGQRARSRFCAGWRLRLTRPTCPGLTASRPAQAQRRRARTAGTCADFVPGGGCALPGLPVRVLLPVGPRKRSAAGQGQRARSRFCAGWRLRLTRPTCPGLTASRPAQAQRRRARYQVR